MQRARSGNPTPSELGVGRKEPWMREKLKRRRVLAGRAAPPGISNSI